MSSAKVVSKRETEEGAENEMTDKKCDHSKVVLRRKYTDMSYSDSWHCDDCEEEFYCLGKAFLQSGPLTIMEPRATLLDQFAMAAMQGLFSASADEFWINIQACQNTTAQAYEWADEMMKARKQ